MDDYSYAYKKSFMDRLGLPVEQFDDVITAKKPITAKKQVINTASAPMNPKDFTVEAAKSFLENNPFVNIDENLTEADKIYNEKLTKAAKEKIKNPSSKVWDSMMEEQAKGAKTIGGKFSEELPRAKAMADEIRKINTAKKPAGIASKVINTASAPMNPKAAPMETPYGKSFLSYTPEGKIAGTAGKILRGAEKIAGPASLFIDPILTMAEEARKGSKGGKELMADIEANTPEMVKDTVREAQISDRLPRPEARLSPEERLLIKELIKIKRIPSGSYPVGDAGFYKTPEGKLVQTKFLKE